MIGLRRKEGYRKNWGPPEAGLLTSRESQVLRMAAEGGGDKGIAECLGISVQTVKVHMSNIREKLGVRRRMEAVALLNSDFPRPEARAS